MGQGIREVRAREHLTEKEVEALVEAARKIGRHGHRDATLILIAYRRGLRGSELIAPHWEQIDLAQGLLHLRRHSERARSSGRPLASRCFIQIFDTFALGIH